MTDEVNKQDEEIAAIEDVAIDTEESGNKFSRGIHSHKSRYSAYSFFTWVCVFSFVSVNSGWGLACINGLFSILSINSCFSILSVNSVFSIGCVSKTFEICF